MVIIFFAYNLAFTRRLDATGRAFTKGSANLVKGTQEAAEGIREIKTLGKEAFFIDSVSSSVEVIAKGGVRLNIFTLLPRGIMEVALIGFIVLLITVNVLLNKDLAGTLSILSIFASSDDQNYTVDKSITSRCKLYSIWQRIHHSSGEDHER